MSNGLEIVLSYLTVTRLTHCYIIITMTATLNGFIVGNTKSSATSARKYFVIKKTLFALKKKFATTGNRRRYY